MSNRFPPEFGSKKKYDTYVSCLGNLKIGDHIFYSSRYETANGFLLFKQPFFDAILGDMWNLLICSEEEDCSYGSFHSPSPVEKRTYLTPAKKICPKIMITKMKIRWIPSASRITRIVKYNGAEEEKEKAKKKKSSRSGRKDEKRSRADETQVGAEGGRQE